MSYEEIPNWSYSGKPVYTQIIVGGSSPENSGRDQVEQNLIPLPLGNNMQNETNLRYTLLKGLFDDRGMKTEEGTRYNFYDNNRERIDISGKIQGLPIIGDDGLIYYPFRNVYKGDTDEMFYSVDQRDQMGGIKKRRKTQRSKGKGKRKNRRSKRR